MSCCKQCQGIEQTFDDNLALDELKDYQEKGPDETTVWLLERLKEENLESNTLLDIGGGIGTIQLELLQAGVKHATSVDASTAYIKTAREEAERQGLEERITHQYGDFVDIAPELEQADIVTLERVICCYHDMPALVSKSAQLAKRYYGAIYPRDTWWLRIAQRIGGFFLWASRNPFRFFVHPTKEVEGILQSQGFKRIFHRQGFIWQVALFEKTGP
ncbi:MAG: methyltransferase domain-containing protein [Chloroflexi bacterium]|nr:MAG: methyltransferase domain-containing protein [Chloroflexota bacterium]MBL1195988.1 methyltransferase domain-containing protein [Chloroflexota bacterium]NOH13282.1 methyltransferase domain-containing protein [Chloroflexota bacterium]